MNYLQLFKRSITNLGLLLLIISCTKEPEVSFIPSKRTTVVGENINFENTSKENKVYNFAWSFGDGGSSSSYHTSYQYAEPGEYTVTLSGTNKRGNKNGTYTEIIIVEPKGIFGNYQLTSGFQKTVSNCPSINSQEYILEGDVLSSTFDFVDEETAIYTDHLGNIRSFFISDVGDEYVTIDLTLLYGSGQTGTLHFRGLYKKDQSGNTLKLSNKGTSEVNSTDGTCTMTRSNELVFTRL